MTRSYQTKDARVLGLLRTRTLTRYQIAEALNEPDHVADKLLESMWERELVSREKVLYAITGRGLAALQLIDAARTTRRVGSQQDEQNVFALAKPAKAQAELDGLAELMRLMKRGRVRATSEADLRPTPVRPGGLRFMECPSRFGDTLRYRDGRVTDMAGNPL